jgi:hypothetical protein
MTQVILIVVLLAGLGWWALHFARAQRPAAPATTAAPATIPLTRADLDAKLKALAANPSPAKLSPGAMCYESIAPPNRLEHVCPQCGEKTLYPTGTPTYGIVSALGHCRRLVQELRTRGLDVKLDEQPLCRRCQPDAKTPGVSLILRFEGEPNPQTVPNITPNDLQLLLELVTGKAVHDGGAGGESALKDHLPRLRELLGAKP